MSDFSATLIQDLQESILQVLEISRTESCSVYVGYEGNQHFATFRSSDGDRSKRVADHNDGLVFLGASLFKVFTATAVAIIIEKLSASSSPSDERDNYHILQGGWRRSFREVFNELGGYQLKPLHGTPKLLDLLLHFQGPRNINHLFMAPDGSAILSEDDFLRDIPQFTEDTRHRNNGESVWCEYSNANYILLALLVQGASKMPFREFLKKHIFDPLEMHQTYTTVEQLGSVSQERRVLPHLVSGDGSRRPILFDTVPYLADTVEFAALGGYISAADLGIFFQALRDAKYGQPRCAELDEKVATSLFRLIATFDGEKDHAGYTPFGISTGLDEDWLGSHSLNRLIPAQSDCWDYTLGKTSAGEQVKVFYMAGSATGWACTAYFLPQVDLFVTVLTNASGPLDASDIISRLYLQEILQLQPSKLGDPEFSCQPLGWETMTLAERYRAHWVELAQRIYDENAALYRALAEEDGIPDTVAAANRAVLGRYTCKKFCQSLDVIDHQGVLRVIMSGKAKRSGLMRLVRKGAKFRICSNGFPGLAIDCFGDWRELELEFNEEKGRATLSREGANLTDVFVRDRP